MGRASESRSWVLASLVLAACSNSEPDVEADTTDSESGTTLGVTDTGESAGPSETDSESETDTGGTEPEPGEPLRFVATGSHAGSDDSVLITLDLADPNTVPPAEILTTVTTTAALRGLTPFGTEIVVHDGAIDQLRLSPENELSLTPLATPGANWLSSAWFGDAGDNALMTTAEDPLDGPGVLLWLRYGAQGQLTDAFDITPPNPPGTHVSVLARSPDSRWAVAATNSPPSIGWDLFLLRIDENPGESFHIDHVNLGGIPAVSVGDYLSVHLDDERVVYRREALVEIQRPVAIAVTDPDAAPASLGPNLPHTRSITAGDDASRLLVTTGGEDGYYELRLIELDGPTSAQPPLTLTEPGTLALENLQPPFARARQAHGFDALGRVFYVYGDSAQASISSVGISLVTVEAGAVVDRIELAQLPPAATIDDVVWDAERQLLGYRVVSGATSWVAYVDLLAESPASVRIDQDFEYDAAAPGDSVGFGWSADASRIAVLGLQQGQAVAHVAELGDPSGTSFAIALPDVEATPGLILDHHPMLSPDANQLMVWFGTQAGDRGLVHARSEGAGMAEIVLAPKYRLASGTWLLPVAP